MIFQPLFDELLTPPPSVDHPAPEVITSIAEVVAPEPAASTGSPSTTTVDQDAPSPNNSQTTPKTQSPIIPNDFCDSDLEVAFRQHTCFIHNLNDVDLLNGSRGNNLYTMSLGDMMAPEQSSSGPALHEMTPVTICSGLVPNPPPSTPFVPPVDYPAPEVIASIAEVVALEPGKSTGSPSSTTVDQDAPSPSKSQTTPETQPLVIPNDVEEDNHDIKVAHMGNDLYFGILIPEVPSDQSSSSNIIHTIVHPDHQISKHNSKWTKDHPLENIIGKLGRPVSTRLHLHEQDLFCYYDAFLTYVKPKTYKDALTQSYWIEGIQEELNEFERLEVWELVPRPNKFIVITLKWIYKVKLDELGGILNNKARLVARGYRQEEGINFEESFALSKYAIESLKKYGFESCDLVDTPIVKKSKIDKDEEGKAVDPSHYRGMIGTLIYLTASRPDLQFAICMCARYQVRPIEKHLHAVKKIFQYLRGIVNRGLWYLKDSLISLTAFADADHVGCQDTRRSTSNGL
nr:uncharacterized mitochondrial protein AtMg00810-like [Tanacetum cinerariifolium]